MSSSRYQSKFLNFISQQSRRLTEQWESGLRHFQVAAKWSVETLLYSISQLLQPDEWTGKRLQAKATTTQPQINPATDAPIQQVLEVVQNLPSDAALQADINVTPFTWLESLWLKFVHKEPKSLPPESKLQYHIPEVRAIATQLSNRSLVLVTTDNRVFDVLTTQQQTTVAQKINKVLAEYQHFSRLAQIEQEKKLLPEINQILHKLTANHSPVDALPESQITQESKPFFELIDTALAKLENFTIIPVQQRSQEIINFAHSQLNIFLYGKDQLAARGQIKIDVDQSEKLENQQPGISELIQAAINYFFGFKSREFHLQEKSPAKLNPSQTNAKVLPRKTNLPPSDFTPDIWLTWDDLFGDEKTTDTNQLPATVEKLQEQQTNQKVNIYAEVENLPKPTSSQILTWLTQLIQGKKADNSQTAQTTQNRIPQLESKPDWIDTSAKFLGYEKHPLEQTLELLDWVLVRLEQIFINLVYFFRGLFWGK